MIDDILTGLFGGALGDRLGRLVKPRKKSTFDHISEKTLRRRNRWIEICATCAFFGCMIGSLVIVGSLHPNGGFNLWWPGFWFGFPIDAAFAVVCFATLPRGVGRFYEFWRFHEIREGKHLNLLLAVYAPFAVLGLVSTYKLIF